MDSSNYNPSEPYIFFISIEVGCSGTGFFDVAWIGNMDTIDLKVMGKEIDFREIDLKDYFMSSQKGKEEKDLDLKLVSSQDEGVIHVRKISFISFNEDETRGIIQYLVRYHRLPICINGKEVFLTPYEFCCYEDPIPFLQVSLYPGPFIESTHEEQMPDELAKRMEKRKQMAKERGNSSSNEMLF